MNTNPQPEIAWNDRKKSLQCGSDRLDLHTQELADVMQELGRCEDSYAKIASDMAAGEHIYPLNEQKLAHLRNKDVAVYSSSDWDQPILWPVRYIPFGTLPPIERIQAVLKHDIGGANKFQFEPSLGAPEQDATAAAKLLDNICNPSYSEPGSIVRMQSPTLDKARTQEFKWHAAGNLCHTPFLIKISPKNETTDVNYNDLTYITTLLTGTKVWFTFPPRHSNLLLLREEYTRLRGSATCTIFPHLAPKLQHGIAIVQKPGQTLMLPPFWAFVAFCTATCVSASTHMATALKLLDRLEHIELYISHIRMLPSKAAEQASYAHYATSLAMHLDLVLNSGSADAQVKAEIRRVCNVWDKGAGTGPAGMLLKHLVAALCACVEDGEEAVRLVGLFEGVWLKFLDEKRKKKSECRLCHVRIEGLEGEGSPTERLARHFREVHLGVASQEAVRALLGEGEARGGA
jgi:hypothetical protein